MKKKRQGMSTHHLTLVRQLPCAVCRTYTGTVQAHHLCIKGERGVGMRASDKWAIPLCAECHFQLHQNGSRIHNGWLRDRGVDGEGLSAALWEVSQKPQTGSLYARSDQYGDKVDSMRSIVFSHEPERVG